VLGQLFSVAEARFQRLLALPACGAKALRAWLWSENNAEARGLKLLREWLSPEQRAQYQAKGYFEVTGCHSGKRYRIHYGTSMNVHEIDPAGWARSGWCFVPNTYLVAGDVMLAQKIALETDELGALAVAKRFSPSKHNPFVHC
jgi:hypothetical protein